MDTADLIIGSSIVGGMLLLFDILLGLSIWAKRREMSCDITEYEVPGRQQLLPLIGRVGTAAT